MITIHDPSSPSLTNILVAITANIIIPIMTQVCHSSKASCS